MSITYEQVRNFYQNIPITQQQMIDEEAIFFLGILKNFAQYDFSNAEELIENEYITPSFEGESLEENLRKLLSKYLNTMKNEWLPRATCIEVAINRIINAESQKSVMNIPLTGSPNEEQLFNWFKEYAGSSDENAIKDIRNQTVSAIWMRIIDRITNNQLDDITIVTQHPSATIDFSKILTQGGVVCPYCFTRHTAYEDWGTILIDYYCKHLILIKASDHHIATPFQALARYWPKRKKLKTVKKIIEILDPIIDTNEILVDSAGYQYFFGTIQTQMKVLEELRDHYLTFFERIIFEDLLDNFAAHPEYIAPEFVKKCGLGITEYRVFIFTVGMLLLEEGDIYYEAKPLSSISLSAIYSFYMDLKSKYVLKQILSLRYRYARDPLIGEQILTYGDIIAELADISTGKDHSTIVSIFKSAHKKILNCQKAWEEIEKVKQQLNAKTIKTLESCGIPKEEAMLYLIAEKTNGLSEWFAKSIDPIKLKSPGAVKYKLKLLEKAVKECLKREGGL